MSTKAVLVRKNRRTFGVRKPMAPSERELLTESGEGECVTIKFNYIQSHAGSFRQPSAATFLSEEGLLPPDSTPIRCNALYLAGKACEKEYEQMLVPLLFFSSGINLLYGRCPFGLAFVF